MLLLNSNYLSQLKWIKESGRSIENIGMDNGGEFKSNEFVNFCNQGTFFRLFNVLYTPPKMCGRHNK